MVCFYLPIGDYFDNHEFLLINLNQKCLTVGKKLLWIMKVCGGNNWSEYDNQFILFVHDYLQTFVLFMLGIFGVQNLSRIGFFISCILGKCLWTCHFTRYCSLFGDI